MLLYIARHGEAEGPQSTDEARQLTARGRDEVSRLWRSLAARGVRPSKLLVSPYVRAQQTAELIAGVFPGTPWQDYGLIVPEGSPDFIIEDLQHHAWDGAVLVSHMPFVGLLTSRLTDGGRHGFPVGGVACIDLELMASGAG
ncbi:MAG: phosphohistidine phosphatase SixA, partial [Gammaproteobacteria bacterium HGW-Gammaproteobacteria-14]